MDFVSLAAGGLAALTLFSPFTSYLGGRGIDDPAARDKKAATEAVYAEYLPGIVCWGDSLTVGAGGDGVTFPDVLAAKIKENITDRYNAGVDEKYRIADVEVVNMGVGGETSATIVGRSGAEPYRAQPFTIPAECTPVKLKIYSDMRKRVLPLIQGDGGVNPVTIGGVRGTLTSTKDSVIERTEYFFTRECAGEPVDIPKGTEIVTYASTMWKDYLNVVFMGTNGNFTSIDDLTGQHNTLLSRSERNGERFIVIGIYKLNDYQVTRDIGTDFYEELEAAMAEEYGDRYINLRKYLTTDALSDAGIEPTEDDIVAMSEGRVPPSLLVDDGLHMNATGYRLLGELVYERMDALGYFDEVKRAK